MCSARVSASFTVYTISQVAIEGTVKEGLLEFIEGSELLAINIFKVNSFFTHGFD